VNKVQAATGSDGLQVDVTTTSPAAPIFSLFSLREPDRLVVDLPDYLWKPGLTAHLPSASPAVQQVRVGQFSAKPPITRVVFDLTPPVRSLRYRAVSSTADGNLRFELSEQLSAAEEGRSWQPIPAPASSLSRPRTQPARQQAPRESKRETAELSGGAAVSEGAATAVGTGPAAVAEGVVTAPRPPQPVRTEPPVRLGRTSDQRTAGADWSGGALRVAGAAALIVLTALFAVWARRRLQSVPQRKRAPAAKNAVEQVTPTVSEPTAETGAPSVEDSDLLRCRVVDGYLVLAPEDRAEELSGSRRVRVKQGTLDLDFLSAEAPPAGGDTASAPALPALREVEGSAVEGLEVATRAADLVASLKDDGVTVRRAAAEGLLELAAGGHAAALLPYLDSADPKVRSLVAGVLGDAAAVDCLAAIARLADDSDPSVRACVMYAFARFGESAAGYADRVRAAIFDPDQSVRAGAVEALAALLPRSEETAQQVLALTEDAEPLVRQAAASATFAVALRGVAEPLMALLADFPRRAQALELLQQADDAVLWRLLAAARNSTATSAQAALDALSYVMSRRWTADDFREELDSPDAEARLASLEGLAMIGGREAVSLVRRVARADASPAVRRRAAEVLAQWEAWVDEATPAPSSSEEVSTKA
jgi:HEAT repeat protein